MPTYTYRCEQCGTSFEETQSMAEHEAGKPRCPKCGGEKVASVDFHLLRQDLEEELIARPPATSVE